MKDGATKTTKNVLSNIYKQNRSIQFFINQSIKTIFQKEETNQTNERERERR